MRRVVTGALEIERAAKRIGSSLEAAPQVFIADPELLDGARRRRSGRDLHHLGHRGRRGAAPAGAFTLDDVAGVAVVPKPAAGKKCARSWRITQDVGSDPAFPDLSARDAAAVREFDARTAAPQN